MKHESVQPRLASSFRRRINLRKRCKGATAGNRWRVLIATLCFAGLMPDGANAELLDLGTLNNGRVASAYGVSADGSVVVGFAIDGATAFLPRAFRWTDSTGMVALPLFEGGRYRYSEAYGVSADGKVVVGYATPGTVGGSALLAFRWTAETGIVSLGSLNPGNGSLAFATSADGSVVVGLAPAVADGVLVDRAFRWTAETGMVNLGTLDGTKDSHAYGVNGDGSVVVGAALLDFPGTRPFAFRWTAETGMVKLGTLNGGVYSWAHGVSADGNVVVGRAENGALDRTPYRAFRWTAETGMVSLGTLKGNASSDAYAVSADGKVVVGVSVGGTGPLTRAFRWTAETGMQSVEDWLRAIGVDVGADMTAIARGTNADGSVVVGELSNGRAFIARGGTGGGDSGGGDSGGSGLLELSDAMATSLSSVGALPITTLRTGDLILHGGHGRPLFYRIPSGQRTVWASGDWGTEDHGSQDGDVALAEVGAGYNFGPLQANVALGRTWTDQEMVAHGDLDADGTYLLTEVLFPVSGKLWGVLTGFYQWGDADIRRGYLNAGLPDYSHGSPDTRTWGLRGRLEWDAATIAGGVSFSPYAEISYLHTDVDRYTETSGGFPAAYDATKADATDARLGVNASYPLSDNTKLLGTLEGVHRFNDEGAGTSGEIVGLFRFDLPGNDYQQNWLRAGIGVTSRLGVGVASLTLNGTTESEAPSAWVAATYQVAF